ncbi:MAG: DNA polymerase III subunit gamma/tau [Cyanobium sp.]
MAQAYQPLHHKYRPQRFDQLVGQEAITATLGNALRTGRIAPAYLFSGPRGTGKTSSARILARSLNCITADGPTPEPCGTCELCTSIAAGNALDVIEIDAASNTGVDNIRELIERSRFAPVQARWKVYVIDECHMLSTAAFNALLKTLEEPPPRVVFILATTDPQRVLPTILSRCQRFDFRRIPMAALEGHLRWIADQEGIGISPEAINVVAQRAQGGLRDAESLLDQLSLLPAPIEAIAVWELLGAVPEQELLELAEAMAATEPLGVVETCRALLERGREPSAVLQGLASLLRDLLLAGVAPDRLDLTSVSPQLRPRLPEVARRIGKAKLLHWQAQLRGSEQQLRLSVQPRLWLEVLVLGLLAEPLAPARPAPQASPAPLTTANRPPAAESGAAAWSAKAAGPAAAVSAATAPIPEAAGSPGTPTRADLEASPPPSTAADSTTSGATAPAEPGPAAGEVVASPNLPELWQQILAGLELPSTRMLLSQQAQLVRLDNHRAVVRVAGTWMAMVQSRVSLLEAAVARALGSPRQLLLEGASEARASSAAAAAPMPTRPTAVAPAAAASPLPPAPTIPVAAPPAGTLPGNDARGPTGATASHDTTTAVLSTAGLHTAGLGAAAVSGVAMSTGSAPTAAAPQTPPPSLSPEAPAADPGSSLPAAPSPGSVAEAAQASPSPATGAAAGGSPAQVPGFPSPIDEKARRLADFFNGEVVELNDNSSPEQNEAA